MAWYDTPIKNALAQNDSLKQMGSMFDNLNSKSQETNKGDFYALLGDILSKQLTDGLPNMDEYRQFTQGNINKSFDRSRTNMKEDLASRGMGGSGAAMAAMAQLEGERGSAMGEAELGFSEMDTNYKQNALSQLLGLNQFSAGVDQTQFNNLFNLFNMQREQYNINRDFQYREDNTPSDFASLLGTILGSGTQIATASLMGK